MPPRRVLTLGPDAVFGALARRVLAKAAPMARLAPPVPGAAPSNDMAVPVPPAPVPVRPRRVVRRGLLAVALGGPAPAETVALAYTLAPPGRLATVSLPPRGKGPRLTAVAPGGIRPAPLRETRRHASGAVAVGVRPAA